MVVAPFYDPGHPIVWLCLGDLICSVASMDSSYWRYNGVVVVVVVADGASYRGGGWSVTRMKWVPVCVDPEVLLSDSERGRDDPVM